MCGPCSDDMSSKLDAYNAPAPARAQDTQAAQKANKAVDANVKCLTLKLTDHSRWQSRAELLGIAVADKDILKAGFVDRDYFIVDFPYTKSSGEAHAPNKHLYKLAEAEKIAKEIFPKFNLPGGPALKKDQLIAEAGNRVQELSKAFEALASDSAQSEDIFTIETLDDQIFQGISDYWATHDNPESKVGEHLFAIQMKLAERNSTMQRLNKDGPSKQGNIELLDIIGKKLQAKLTELQNALPDLTSNQKDVLKDLLKGKIHDTVSTGWFSSKPRLSLDTALEIKPILTHLLAKSIKDPKAKADLKQITDFLREKQPSIWGEIWGELLETTTKDQNFQYP